jgi:anti-sigma regulatory factor (Ser/Thr protein kinase)
MPPDPRFSASVRRQISSFAMGCGLSGDELATYMAAVGEALANAIEHSSSREAVDVQCRIEPDKIVAIITDAGNGFPVNRQPEMTLPNAYAERGRGLPIMRRFSDIFALASSPGRGTSVFLGRYVRGRRDHPA